MNYIRHLSGFFQKVASDNRLNPTHVSLYMAIFQFWNASHFQTPVSISRQELMRISKICAKATYHKCIRELHNFGYFNYEPSFNPFKGSLVYMFEFQTTTKPLALTKHTKIETSIEQAVAPYINDINILNKNCENETNPQNDIVVRVTKNKVEVVEAHGEKITKANRKDIQSEIFTPPKLEKVKKYFLEQNAPEVEAQKFYNYFQSNGWKVGGKASMKDWQASARNWILNIHQFSPHRESVKHQPTPGNLSTTTGKDYAEPL